MICKWKTRFEYLGEIIDRDTNRLADEIAFNRRFYYAEIEGIHFERQVIILSKFTDSREVLSLNQFKMFNVFSTC